MALDEPCFVMSNGVGIMPTYGLEVDLWWSWGFDTVFYVMLMTLKGSI